MRLNRCDVSVGFSEGARLLWEILSDRDWSQGQMAEHLGDGRPALNHWLYGDRRPGLRARMLLQKSLRIKWQAWDQPPSKPFSTPAAVVMPPTGTEGR